MTTRSQRLGIEKFIRNIGALFETGTISLEIFLQFWEYCKQYKSMSVFCKYLLNSKYNEQILTFFEEYRGNTFQEKIFNALFINDESSMGFCGVCGKQTTFISITRGYRAHCSVACTRQSPAVLAKTKANNLQKYGYDSHFKVPEIQNKIKGTMLERYGVENSRSSKLVRQKAQDTIMQRYGKDYQKIFNERSKRACLIKYGVENVSQSPIVRDNQMKAGYKRKQIIAFGKEYYVQGCEDRALKFLEKYDSTICDITNKPSSMPHLSYLYEDKPRRYFPDFYIPSKGIIIEVKSEFTVTRDVERNKAKFKSVSDAGFKFCLLIQIGRSDEFRIEGVNPFN